MQDNKLKIWIENGLNNEANVEVVFIKYEGILNINKPKYSKFDWIDTSRVNSDCSSKFINSIITTNQISKLQKLFYNSIKDGFIFIEDEDSIKKLIFAIETKDTSICNEIKYSLVKPISLQEILFSSIYELNKFIEERENILKIMNYKYVKFDEEDLKSFLEVYYKRKILIASFIQKIYRLANLDFLISEKKIGEKLKNILDVASKIKSKKYVGYGRYGVSNIRIYDLNFNQTELDTKIKIATNLLKLNLKELDIKQISKNTDLSINQVEKIYKKIFIK